MQDSLRQRLMIMSAKLVAKNSLLLLLVAYWDRHYAMWTWSKMINFSICRSSSESALAKSTLACDDTKLLQSHQIQFCCSWCERYNCVDWISVSLIEFESLIVFLILICIVFMRFCNHVILQQSRSSCSDRRQLLLRSAFDLFCSWYFDSWKCSWYLEALNSERDLKLFLYDLNIENSFWIEVFDKLRLLFQSSWCSWFVVTAVDNRELEMIDACRLKCQWEIEWSKTLM